MGAVAARVALVQRVRLVHDRPVLEGRAQKLHECGPQPVWRRAPAGWCACKILLELPQRHHPKSVIDRVPEVVARILRPANPNLQHPAHQLPFVGAPEPGAARVALAPGLVPKVEVGIEVHQVHRP